MNEIANFFVKFTTDGLTELKQGFEDIEKRLDKMEQGLTKSTGSFGKMFDSAGQLATKIGLVTTAIKAMKDALNLKDQVISLQNLATSVGVGADKIEGMGRALRQFGGDWKTAGGLYGRITDMMTQLHKGKFTQSDLASLYGVDIAQALVDKDYEGVLAGIANAMSKQEFAGFQRDIAQGFLGGDQALDLFFRQGWGTVVSQIGVATQRNYMSDPETQRQSRQLLEATFNLKEAWDKAVLELSPALTELTKAITPLIESLKPLFAGIGAILETLSPIIAWLAEKIGGVFKAVSTGLTDTTAVLGAGWDWATGKINKDEFLNTIGERETAKKAAGLWNKYQLSLLESDATRAFQNIKDGQYTMQDILAGRRWLDANPHGLSFEQINAGSKMLNDAAAQLSLTNNPLNSSSVGTVDNSDNRGVWIETINVHDNTGTMVGKGNEIGNAIKTGVGQSVLQPAYNTKVSY